MLATAALLVGAYHAAASTDSVQPVAAQIPTLNWQKRSDWLDVRSHGAKGDGKTDDTAAIAKALLAQTDTEYGCGQPGHCGNATKTIYFPPGVYPISKQLVINHMYGGALLGHGAATTILWVGDAAPPVAGPEYAMLLDNGTSYFHFEGLTWDGGGKAATAVDHNSQTHYGTWMRHRNCAYQHFTQAGVRVGGGIFAHNGSWVHGNERMATAEVSYRNCVFRNTTIGIALYSYNDLDQVVSGCHFEDNEIGIFTPHGNFYLYNSRFERSRMFDTYWGAPGSSARRVVSINSTSPVNVSTGTMFALMGAWCSAANTAKIEDCRIEGWRGATVGDGGWWDTMGPLPAVALAWRGPLRVVDTTFSSANSSTPAIASFTAQQSLAVSGWPDNIENGTWAKTYITSGNTYDGPLLGMTEGDTNHSVPAGELGPSKITTDWNPVRDWWPISGSVIDCKSMGALGNATIGSAANDDTAAIQKCIDAAAAAGKGAVAYLGPGSFVVRGSLNLVGRDFSVEGAGTSTYISMLPDTQKNPASANDTLFAVSDTSAFNITLAEFWIVKPKGAPALVMKGSAAEQAEPSAVSRLVNVDRVICMDNSSTGFVLTGLGSTDVFNAGMFGCTLNVVDNAGGTIFVAFHEGGQTRLSAPSKPFSGFVGQQYMGAGEDAFNIIIEDSCSYVMDNMYTESTFQNFHLSGKATDKPGRVTISGVKEEQIPPSSVAGVLDGFVGNFTFAGAGWGPGYGPDLTMSVRQTGSASVLLLGNSYMEMVPTFEFSDMTKLNTLGNIIYFQGDKITPKMQSYCAAFGPPDAQCLLKDQGGTTALALASGALDDIRKLGLVDLELNFKSTLPAVKTDDHRATVLGMRLPPPVRLTRQNLRQEASIPTLNLLPKSDWLNVKTCCGAKGDGKTDDASAIQKALDMLTDTPYGCNIPGQCSNATKTLYFPPGTYAISRTVVIAGVHNNYAGAVMGHGAATTILWIGPAMHAQRDPVLHAISDPAVPAECAHTMWLDNGTSYFHYEGLTWNGQGKAAVGIDHYSHRDYGTFMLHRSEAFHGFNISGIRIGGSNGFGEKMATAEIRYQNCHFSSSRNGIMPQSYNDLDNIIEGCLFEDCDVGVNTAGHGNFYLRDSRFERSAQTDVIVAATSATIRRVVSVNSTAFLRSGCCSAAAPVRIEDCRIHQNRSLPWLVDPVPTIGESWRGPLQIIDTTFTPTLTELCKQDPTCAQHSSLDFIDNATLWDIDTGETFSSDQFRNYTDPKICQAECQNATLCIAWTYMKVSYINKGNGGVCIMFTQLTKIYKQGKLAPRTKPLGPYPGCNLYSYPCASGFLDSPMADSWTSGWEQTVLLSNNHFGKDGSHILGETGGKTGNRALVIPHTMTELGASDLNLDSQFLKSTWPTVTNIFDARTMGAKGDGVTDDSAAVQATVDAAAKAGHGASAYFGPGRFIVKHPISVTQGSNFTIEGSGAATYFVWSGAATNDSVFAIGAVASVTIQEFWVAKGIHQPLIHVQPGTEVPRMVHIDRVLSTDGGPNNYTDILLEGLSAKDTVNIGQIVCDLAIIDSSPGVTLVAMNEGGTTLVANSIPGRVPMPKHSSRREDAPDAQGFHGELTKIASGNPYDLIVRDSLSYVIGDQYTESTLRNILLEGAGSAHTGANGRVTVSGIKLENDGDRTIMVIDGYNGNFSHSASEWWKPAAGPFIVTQSGGGDLEMTFYGEAFDSQVPVFDVEASTKLYFGGNLISFSGQEDAATKAFCEKQKQAGTNKDACVYPDQLEPNGLSRVSAAMDHLRLLGRWDLYLNYPEAVGPATARSAAQ